MLTVAPIQLLEDVELLWRKALAELRCGLRDRFD
jgi:hypothetical protein